MKSIFITTLLFIVCLTTSSAKLPQALRERICALTDSVDAEVGVAILTGDGDTIAVNNNRRYPMLSVFKFHQALAVCDWLEKKGRSVEMPIKVRRSSLRTGTWSPLRDEHPTGGRFTVGQLLEYTLVYSDNNACDILFDNTCSLSATNDYIHATGITDCSITNKEAMMHADINRCYDNWCTPMSAVRLLEYFYTHREDNANMRFVWNTMANCKTGTARIPKYISTTAATITHKTGTSDRDAVGRIIAVNDIATITLPDGTHYNLAVFVKDAACSMEQCEELIATISRLVSQAMQ